MPRMRCIICGELSYSAICTECKEGLPRISTNVSGKFLRYTQADNKRQIKHFKQEKPCDTNET